MQNSRNEVSVVQLKVTPPGDDFKVTTVLEGSEYKLKAEVDEHDREYCDHFPAVSFKQHFFLLLRSP